MRWTRKNESARKVERKPQYQYKGAYPHSSGTRGPLGLSFSFHGLPFSLC
jgi:hypothetical protein